MDQVVNGMRQDGTPFRLGYVPALDGVRGVAILAVMAFNGQFIWMGGGFLGVDIFFTLSGFLITALLIQGYDPITGIGLKNFYFRRALRLLPALFLLILFCIAYALLLQPSDKAANTLNGVVYSLFYVANWAQAPPNPPGIGPLSHTWSLSVEEQFYVVWPLLLLLLLRLNSKRLVILILGVLATISVVLNIWFWQAGVPYLRMYFGTDTKANELLIGCIAALLLSWRILTPGPRFKMVFHSLALVGLGGIFAAFFLARHTDAFVYNGGFTLIALGTAIVVLDILLFPSAISRCFEFPPLVWIGKISYGLYLWHYPVFEGMKRLFEERLDPVLMQVSGIVLTLLIAASSYYFLERWFLKLKSRYKSDLSDAPLFGVSTRAAEGV